MRVSLLRARGFASVENARRSTSSLGTQYRFQYETHKRPTVLLTSTRNTGFVLTPSPWNRCFATGSEPLRKGNNHDRGQKKDRQNFQKSNFKRSQTKMNDNKQDPRPQNKSPPSKQCKHSNHNNRPQLKNRSSVKSAENKPTGSKQPHQVAEEVKEMEQNQQIPLENLSEDDKAALTEGFYFFAKDTTFPQLGITNNKLLEALATTGITQPARIQAKAIPLILQGEDVIIGAETGSGKTLAYLLPLIQNLVADRSYAGAKERFVRAIVMLPNKELCEQVKTVVSNLVPPHVLTCGLLLHKDGMPTKRPELLIATAVALKSVLDANPEFVTHIKHVVIDEADMMLSGGFYDSVNLILAGMKRRTRSEKTKAKDLKSAIRTTTDPQKLEALHAELKQVTHKKQFLFVAATLPQERNNKSAKAFIDVHFDHAKLVEINLHKTLRTIKQDWVFIEDMDKSFEQLTAVIEAKAQEMEPDAQTIIFVNTIHSAELLNLLLKKANINALMYHGELNKGQAEANLKDFLQKKANFLVSSNVLSRGIDFTGVRHIIQFEFAGNKIEHLHRIGRTARGGAKGFVTNFYTENDMKLVQEIQKADQEASKQRLIFKQNRRRIDLRQKKLKGRKMKQQRGEEDDGSEEAEGKGQEEDEEDIDQGEDEENEPREERKGQKRPEGKEKREDRTYEGNDEGKTRRHSTRGE